MTHGCAPSVQAVVEQRVLDALSVEHAADAVDTEAPEGTFAVVEHQVAQPLELLPSGGWRCRSPRSQRAQVFGVTCSSCAASTWVSAPSARRSSTRSSSELLDVAELYVTSRSTRACLLHAP